jgi:hypothetical protein
LVLTLRGLEWCAPPVLSSEAPPRGAVGIDAARLDCR